MTSMNASQGPAQSMTVACGPITNAASTGLPAGRVSAPIGVLPARLSIGASAVAAAAPAAMAKRSRRFIVSPLSHRHHIRFCLGFVLNDRSFATRVQADAAARYAPGDDPT